MSIHWGGRGAGHVSRWSASTTGVPALALNFLSGTLDPRVTFTRSSTASFVGSNGLIQSAAINAPRFDYSPSTLAAKGLLIEESRANAFSYSNDFSNVIWTKSNCSIILSGTSPDGTANTNVLVENSASGNHWFFATNSVVGSYTLSVYAKPNTRNWLVMRVTLGTGNAIAFFNVSTGVVGTLAAGLTATITPAGNGFYRCSIRGTLVVGAVVIGAASADGVASYAGNSGNALGLYGAQLEAGAFATSPTTTVAVTRSADIATMTGTNFSSWYNQTQGSFVAVYEASSNTFTTYLAASNGVVAQNSMHMDNDGAGNMRVAYYSGSSAVALLSLGAVGTIGAVNRIATAYKANDFAAARNGGTVVTDTLGAVPVSVTQLNIGADPSGAAVNVTNTHIQSITYYNTRLYNSQLQTLTQ